MFDDKGMFDDWFGDAFAADDGKKAGAGGSEVRRLDAKAHIGQIYMLTGRASDAQFAQQTDVQVVDKVSHGYLQEWLQTEKRVVVIHRLHQILEPFMLRRQVQDVESRLPEKVRSVELLRCCDLCVASMFLLRKGQR